MTRLTSLEMHISKKKTSILRNIKVSGDLIDLYLHSTNERARTFRGADDRVALSCGGI